MIRIAGIEHLKLQAYRMAVAAMFGFFAMLCGVVLMICLVAALWIYLIQWVGPVGAPLLVGAIFLMAAIGLIFAAKHALNRARPPRPIVPEMASNIPLLTRNNMSVSGMRELGKVAIAGFIVGMMRKP